MATVLKGINDGIAVSKAMFAAFSELNLIEPVTVEVKLSAEEQFNLVGLYTISEPKLAALDGEALVKLHKSRFLHGAFLVITSLSNVRRLIALKQRKAHGGHS
jgi:hypothetical protein